VSVSAGDVTGGGIPDLVVGYVDFESGDRFDVYEGEGGLSSTPDRTIDAESAGVEALRCPKVVGDVSGAGRGGSIDGAIAIVTLHRIFVPRITRKGIIGKALLRLVSVPVGVVGVGVVGEGLVGVESTWRRLLR